MFEIPRTTSRNSGSTRRRTRRSPGTIRCRSGSRRCDSGWPIPLPAARVGASGLADRARGLAEVHERHLVGNRQQRPDSLEPACRFEQGRLHGRRRPGDSPRRGNGVPRFRRARQISRSRDDRQLRSREQQPNRADAVERRSWLLLAVPGRAEPHDRAAREPVGPGDVRVHEAERSCGHRDPGVQFQFFDRFSQPAPRARGADDAEQQRRPRSVLPGQPWARHLRALLRRRHEHAHGQGDRLRSLERLDLPARLRVPERRRKPLDLQDAGRGLGRIRQLHYPGGRGGPDDRARRGLLRQRRLLHRVRLRQAGATPPAARRGERRDRAGGHRQLQLRLHRRSLAGMAGGNDPRLPGRPHLFSRRAGRLPRVDGALRRLRQAVQDRPPKRRRELVEAVHGVRRARDADLRFGVDGGGHRYGNRAGDDLLELRRPGPSADDHGARRARDDARVHGRPSGGEHGTGCERSVSSDRTRPRKCPRRARCTATASGGWCGSRSRRERAGRWF